jgi:hypothetical protein
MVDLKTIDFAAIGDRVLRRPLDESREPDVRAVDPTR